MNYEANRLNTFNNWPSSAPVDPIRIAKAGFFSTGEGTEVKCFCCGNKISQWNYGDQVMWRHRQLKPDCPFVLQPELSGNVPLVLGQEQRAGVATTHQALSSEDVQNDHTYTAHDYGLTEEDETYQNDALRLLSFVNWDDTLVSREALVYAGFYHAGEGRLRCAWCGGQLEYFNHFRLEPPLEVHRMYFPRCQRPDQVQATTNFSEPSSPAQTPSPPNEEARPDSPPLNNQPQSSGAAHNERVLSEGGTWRNLGVVGSGARHPQYACLNERLGSFARWPADRPQAPRALAEAGFFHTGTDDQVRCFYCDGGLGKWEAGDTPWSEHAFWFPHCGYVILVKGQEFIDATRRRHAVKHTVSISAERSRQRNAAGNITITESQVEECMESAIAAAALGAGLDAARVRRAIAKRLRNTGIPFSSSEALIDAVLDEQLNEEPWGVSQQSRLARDILAETFGDFPNPSRRNNAANQMDRLAESESEPESEDDHPPPSSPPPRQPQPAAPTSKPPENTSSAENVESTPEPEGKKLSLEEENRQLKEARLCKVCMDSEVSVVFLPCGHMVSCGRCGAALGACPLCRAAVRALVRAYLA
ncbi:unnamed protein product [Chrysodeixis includens]|uniref:RING-type domain-containing protein n=1 Tax=Chrysodeixis includens TaxID=689277 RepID=A0A9P0FR40_CHRIL|nr:unnamed protein product [Chrysodeixis includens]